MRYFLLILIFLFVAFPTKKINASDNSDKYEWVYSIIEKFSHKGLLEKDLIEIVKSRGELSTIEWAYVLNALLATFDYKAAKEEDLVLLDKLTQEFKYEILLLKVRNLENEIIETKGKIEIGGELRFTFDVYDGDLPWEKEEMGGIPSPSRIGIEQRIGLCLTGKVSPNSLIFVKLRRTGYWGAKYNPGIPETIGPLNINES
ncbi:MAG: hypothetical protein QMD92_07865 [bacterium]|nr:hypothetical protein [bacterium]